MRLLFCGLLAVLAGCGGASAGTSSAVPLEGVSFTPGLQVDLTQMERTSSGVYWRELVVGEGPQVTRGQRVSVHYAGFLPDGTPVDANAPPSAPYTFVLGQGRVIRGWEAGLLGMRAGGQRQLVIPPSEGYGGRRVGKIPPNSTLVFIVQLVSAR
jgi:FKBP-type peptidyl-prolyl cis-trans isomerase FkpA